MLLVRLEGKAHLVNTQVEGSLRRAPAYCNIFHPSYRRGDGANNGVTCSRPLITLPRVASLVLSRESYFEDIGPKVRKYFESTGMI